MSEGRNGAWERLTRGEVKGWRERLAVAGLWSLSALYGGALKVHRGLYRVGIARRTRLPAQVISVGNLTVGGTGKTTATMAVARWLSDRGMRVAVLSRGYRGGGESKRVVVSEGFGPLVEAEEAGDEPYMMARALSGVAVVVGKDRRRTGREAIARTGAEVLVLDDGFQYQRLVKDVEIVLVDALAPFGYDFLVPRGRLREPAESLARADAVWLTHADLVRESDVGELKARVAGLAPKARVWEARHEPVRLRRLGETEEVELGALRGRRVVALSSVGNPAAFERTLGQLGAVVAGRARFPDHYRYRSEDLRGLLSGREDLVVTTEKDAVRLPVGEIGREVWVLEVELAGREEGRGLSEELAWLLRTQRRT